MSDHKAFKFKVLLVGNGSVGKTSLINRFVNDKFEKQYLMTLGNEITKYSENVNGNTVSLIFWDIAGQAGFKAVREGFFAGTNAAILVFSHEDNEVGEQSLQDIPNWLEEIANHQGKIPTILFGNKIDLINPEKLNTRSLPNSDFNMNKLAEDLGCIGYFKTSALSGEQVREAFKTLINELYKRDKAILDNLKMLL